MDCPDAQESYDESLVIYEELLSSVPFNTEWEVQLRQNQQRKPHMAESFLPLSARYDYGREIEVQGKLTLDVPGPPPRLSCDAVVQIEVAAGEAAESIMHLYYYSILSGYAQETSDGEPLCSLFAPPGLEDLFCSAEPWAIPVEGTATSSWSGGGEWEFIHCSPTPMVLLCCLPSPCPISENLGCSGGQSHELNGSMGVIWEPDESLGGVTGVEFDLIDLAVVPDLAHEGTQLRQDCDFLAQRDWGDCMVECALAGDTSLCCADICLNVTAQDIQEEIDCDVNPRPLSGWTFPPAEGTHTLRSYESETSSELVEFTLRCTSGCECSEDDECDDGRVCTRDECQNGNCTYTPDDSIVPEQVEGDCRYCEDGTERSVRAAFEQQCELIRQEALQSCSALGDNWRVHWIEETPGSIEQWHYCLAGETPASAAQPICLGSGVCASGTPTTVLTGQHSTSCLSSDGQELDFSCDVMCTVCN